MTDDAGSLEGLRILVVEDVGLVADVLCGELEDCGCEIVGPVTRLAPALARARQETLDGAILDIHLGGELSFPVARVLRARNIPFVFLSGYEEDSADPPDFATVPRLRKPIRGPDLVALMIAHLKQKPR